MRIRGLGLATTLSAVAFCAGCGLIGSTPSEPEAQAGEITVDGSTYETQSVECTQIKWDLTIDATAETGSAEAFLVLGGTQPEVRTVNIENVNEVTAVAGGQLGEAEATTNGNVYTITGTVVGSDPANPGRSRTMPFEIKAPC
ncbi:lipoprotein LpqH [Mycobacterium sp. IDR2000157661]|uniref:lipoprotein LpqH n=1 Tax=Mycobacterium sp. IDR2000157661 TaxID=2867005 RepID=UPI001EEB1B8E|nr:lipoprotein LpqH [Mycobacterium sp. IDR2000157661]ULE34066.1 lipoprotein LpqH [Mycobacterium sp. IDR2000157661]